MDIKKIIPIIIITTIVLVIGITNFKAGTYLIGWDNLQTELSPWLNLKRAIFTGWQQYQGVGLAGGMGHAADLVRQILLIPLYVLPNMYVRYVSTILTLWIGTIGAYFMLKKLLLSPSSVILNSFQDPKQQGTEMLKQVQHDKNSNETMKQSHSEHLKLEIRNLKFSSTLPLAGSLFYLLNLGTMQSYFAPFEVFTTYFAALPWMLLTTILFFQNPTRKRAAILFFTLFLATPAAYVPTLFIVYCTAAALISLFFLKGCHSEPFGHSERSEESHGFTLEGILRQSLRMTIKKLFFFGLIVFLANAFWMLPFAYFPATQASVNINGKINQMATENIFALNKEFGTPWDVALLKGFWFNSTDPDVNGTYQFILAPWREHLSHWPILFIGYLLFAVILYGVYRTWEQIRTRHSDKLVRAHPESRSWTSQDDNTQRVLKAFLAVLIMCLILLLAATPPFSIIDAFLRNQIPLFGQVFRFVYTKFAILTALTYAFFFTIGLTEIIRFLDGRKWSVEDSKSKGEDGEWKSIFYHLPSTSYLLSSTIYRPVFLPILSMLLMIIFMFPMFTGHLFYAREQIAVPKEYFQLFDYFKKQDPHARIANVPQPSFWGWDFYKWPQPKKLGDVAGYGGSGFLWYGIQQPILDRAFDVWSPYSENYYYELSEAIYSLDEPLLWRVLQKYQVSFILLDKSVINPVSPQSTFIPETETMLSQIKGITKTAEFGKLVVYHVDLQDHPKNFVFAAPKLPTANRYTWSSDDKAYGDLGNYISTPPVIPNSFQDPQHISKKMLKQVQHDTVDVMYPFRSLFSLKTGKEKQFSLTEEKDALVLSQTLPSTHAQILTIPSLAKTQKIIPMVVKTQVASSGLTIMATVKTPEIFLNNKQLWSSEITVPLFTVNPENGPFTMDINGGPQYIVGESITCHPERSQQLNNETMEQCPVHTLGTTFLSLTQDNVITLTGGNGIVKTIVIKKDDLSSLPVFAQQTIMLPAHPANVLQTLTIKVPKMADNYLSFSMDNAGDQAKFVSQCDGFRNGKVDAVKNTDGSLTITSSNATGCLTIYTPHIFHHNGYALFVKTQNTIGRGLHLWVENIDQRYVPVDTFLDANAQMTGQPFIIAPQDPFGNYYAFHLENVSVGKDTTINSIASITLYPFPYNFVTEMTLSDSSLCHAERSEESREILRVAQDDNTCSVITHTTSNPLTVTHPNESLYTVSLREANGDEAISWPETLVLSQAYNAGWQAYQMPSQSVIPDAIRDLFPFIFGKRITPHVEINNWENGWILSNENWKLETGNSTVVVVYLPQYLEYLGFIVLIISTIYFSLNMRALKNQGK